MVISEFILRDRNRFYTHPYFLDMEACSQQFKTLEMNDKFMWTVAYLHYNEKVLLTNVGLLHKS